MIYKEKGRNGGGFSIKINKRNQMDETLLHDEALSNYVAELPGTKILKRYRELIRLMKTLTPSQLTLSELFIQPLLPFIYGKDYKDYESSIKSENNMDEHSLFYFVPSVRGMGCEIVTAWACACVLVSIPSVKILVFYPGKRQSGYFMDCVRSHIEFIRKEYTTDIEIKKNSWESFNVCINGTLRELKVLPAKETTLRGVDGGNLIMCPCVDAVEPSFMQHFIFPLTAAPSCSVRNTYPLEPIPIYPGLVCIGYALSRCTELVNMKGCNGKSLFKTFKFEEEKGRNEVG